MADPETNTSGRVESSQSALAKSSVELVRLERISAFRACVHRLSAMPAPARCTTASNGPSRSRASPSMNETEGSHATWVV